MLNTTLDQSMEKNSQGSAQPATGMVHIRPYQLLGIADDYADQEEIKFFMPPAQGAGSLSTLESVLLIKLLRLVEPDYIFEFGTYKGYTTRLLLENITASEATGPRIYTLDLPELSDVVFQGKDKELAQEALGFQRKYLKCTRVDLVKQLLQDSMALDVATLPTRFDYIFVDANHELSYVRRDTENAFKMLADAPSCVLWHDYGNPQFPELTQYLDELAHETPLYHVENTMLVFHLRGKDVLPRNA
jgi:predicted O-methyltransferase YrrM